MNAALLSRREINRAEKRARITAAARALFTTKGFAATTTKEVARAAGVASGTVFTYAASKEELLILVFHDEMLDVVARSFRSARALPKERVVERLTKYFSGLIEYHAEDLSLARALMRELGYLEGEQSRALLDELMSAIYGHLADLLELEDASRGKRSAGAASQARIVFAIYYLHLGAWLNAVVGRPRFEQMLREDLTTLFSATDAAGPLPSADRAAS